MGNRFNVLDGWRGISILLILICHFLPVNYKHWYIGTAIGIAGMSFFFVLSGFLITNHLIKDQRVSVFLTRRFFRILPLAWLYLAVVFFLFPTQLSSAVPHFLFYANYPPKPLIPHLTDHFWSLCVEIQFYVGIALLVAIFKRRGLLLIPILCIFFTLLRVYNGALVSVETHLRVDEILAGSSLALAYNRLLGEKIIAFISKANPYILFVFVLAASYSDLGWICYFRPYFAALLIGATLYHSDSKLSLMLANKYLAYLATISFAVYVVHPLLGSTWLGSGDALEKYAKRPVLFAAVIFVSHISTNYYEKYMIFFGKAISVKINVCTMIVSFKKRVLNK